MQVPHCRATVKVRLPEFNIFNNIVLITILSRNKELHMKSFLKYACVLAFVLAPKAYSQAPEILITPNRFEQKASNNTRSVEVITSEQIEKSNQRNIIDLLRKSVGIDIVQTGALGRAASTFIRGAESDHTLILIDGIRVNDPNVGSFDLADLQLDNIERIEIVKGASSVSYGSEAIGGVINIVTKESKGASFKALGGSFGTHSEQITIGQKTEVFSNSFSASYLSSDGLSAATPSTEDDAYENISISSRHKLRLNKNTFLNLHNRAILSKTELDGFEFGVGPVDDLNFEQNRDLVTTGLSLDSKLSEATKLKAKLSYSNERLTGSDPDTSFNNFDIRGENTYASLSLSNTLKDFITDTEILGTLGVDYLNRQGENQGNFDNTRDTISFWTDNSISYQNFILNLGIRIDDNSDFGNEVTYSASSRYNLDSLGSNFHASFGTGFKAPSFNELFFPNFGNPELDAEESTSYDLGLKYYLSKKANFDVTLFYNDFDNLISFDSSTFLAENISDARARGVESVLNYDICPGLSMNLNYVYNDTKDENTGFALARRARHKAGVQFFVEPADNLDLTFSYRLVNSRRENDGSRLDNFELADLSMNYSLGNSLDNSFLSKGTKLFLRLDNLFDEDYSEVAGFATAGFSAFAGIEIKAF